MTLRPANGRCLLLRKTRHQDTGSIGAARSYDIRSLRETLIRASGFDVDSLSSVSTRLGERQRRKNFLGTSQVTVREKITFGKRQLSLSYPSHLRVRVVQRILIHSLT